tara:strand:+ start:991 stop:1143 length:153 start_codon:yes stop_codon:yes gene_type:complete
LTVIIAALAVRTGISPSALRECSSEELDALYRVLEHQNEQQKKAYQKNKL